MNHAPSDRRLCWAELMTRIATPIYDALASGQLHATMPVEARPGAAEERARFTHLEAIGRSLSGIAPWLNLPANELTETEAALRARLLDQVLAGLPRMVDPGDPDYIDFDAGHQILVDSAFLAEGFLRGWDGVWMRLSEDVRSRFLDALQKTRQYQPADNNWTLFASTIEAFLLRNGIAPDKERIERALNSHAKHYRGDSLYGDGWWVHMDYYNSFVMHPMLLETAENLDEAHAHLIPESMDMATLVHRSQRHACILERMIAPDGTFPVLGRSMAYRSGAFHLLALMALRQQLADELAPAAVRCALTRLHERVFGASNTFDDNGWLRIGLAGHQPGLGEHYISTGSLYLCLASFLPLGLAPSDPFWSSADAPWTSVRAWSGEDLPADHAI